MDMDENSNGRAAQDLAAARIIRDCFIDALETEPLENRDKIKRDLAELDAWIEKAEGDL